MRILVIIASLAIAACGAPEQEPEPVSGNSRVPETSVFHPLTSTLDRAQGVENTLQDSAAARRRQLEEAEGR